MTNPPDIPRTLGRCMLDIEDACKVMATDMPNAAMKLDAAAMMLASASAALHKRAAVPLGSQQPGE